MLSSGGRAWARSLHRRLSTAAPAAISAATANNKHATPTASTRNKIVFDNRLTLSDFLAGNARSASNATVPDAAVAIDSVPYLVKPDGQRRKFYVEVYGCQMNVNDTEILNAILTTSGFIRTHHIVEADVVFLMTCAIREGAESKIWHRLRELRSPAAASGARPLIGVLGCMAERLRDKLLDADKLVDVVCGPDAYRSLPYLLSLHDTTHNGVANVMLSADETYADIMPLRLDADSVSAHLSIMRGCNNMCSFCIVPFTRGTERSRPIASILDEVKRLYDQGVKEVTLLGQNVNSYLDTSAPSSASSDITLAAPPVMSSAALSPGFNTIYKSRAHLDGNRFTELLAQVAHAVPNMRIRFTSPHPKDFPLALLHVIRENNNVCKQIHLPAQSGSSSCLARMRRGYTREAYFDLVETIRKVVPNVALSTDIIAGFCGETDAEHRDTVSLMEQVGYSQAFMFAYSMREKTHAHRRLVDSVPQDVKHQRLAEIISMFHRQAKRHNEQHVVGTTQLVLVDGTSKRDSSVWSGRADSNLKVNFTADSDLMQVCKGQYVAVQVTGATSMSLSGHALRVCDDLQAYYSGC